MTEIQEQSTNALAETVPQASWGSENIEAQDILIPKVLLMQGLSEYVEEGKAQSGDQVLSTSGAVVAGKGNPLEVICISTFKTMEFKEKVGNKFEFKRSEPKSAANAGTPREFEQDGALWQCNEVINFYGLLPSQIAAEAAELEKAKKGEMPDPDCMALPVVLSFRRTSYTAGKAITTHFSKARQFGVPPAVKVFQVVSKQVKNDQGSFYVFDVEPGRKSTADEIAVCRRWYETIAKSNVIVDEPDIEPPQQYEEPGQDEVANTPF